MLGMRKRFNFRAPLRFLSRGNGPTIQGLLVAALVVAIAVPALYLALQPGSAVEGQEKKPPPQVSLGGTSPSGSVEEDSRISVTVILSRALTEKDDKDRARCYGAGGTTETPCIEGGIIVWDSYNDHEEGELADELIAFKFRPGQQERILGVSVDNDGCKTTSRTIRVAINRAFDSGTYGYTISGSEIRVSVTGKNDSDDDLCPVMTRVATRPPTRLLQRIRLRLRRIRLPTLRRLHPRPRPHPHRHKRRLRHIRLRPHLRLPRIRPPTPRRLLLRLHPRPRRLRRIHLRPHLHLRRIRRPTPRRLHPRPLRRLQPRLLPRQRQLPRIRHAGAGRRGHSG